MLGDGTTTITTGTVAVPITLKEYTTTGNQTGFSVALPTADSGLNYATTAGMTAITCGFLKRSVDGRYLTLSGANIPAGVQGNVFSNILYPNRVIARIDSTGNVDASTRFSANGATPGSVITTNGTDLWWSGNTGSGSTGGIRYLTLGGTSGVMLAQGTGASLTTPGNPAPVPLNARVLNIFDGQLYATSGVSVGTGNSSVSFRGVFNVGTGLPTTANQFGSLLVGSGTANAGLQDSAYDFYFADASTLYVADDDTSDPASGGITKWIRSGTTWTKSWLALPAGATGVRAIAGVTGVGNGTVELYGVTAVSLGQQTQLVKLVDTLSGTTAPSFTTLATAPANYVFRGVAMAPTASQSQVPTISATPSALGNFTANSGTASASQSFTVSGSNLSANITATAPAGFEISTNNSSFSSSLDLPESSGNVTDTTLYARIAASAPTGSISGNITLASTGATTQIVALSGTVGSIASLATLATTPVSSSIRTTTATLGGEVTADGGAAITARGVVYSLTATDSDPQVGVSGVTNLPATGTTGVFSVNATALTPGAVYTFKAYATNSAGTSYSAAGSFTALRPVEGWRLSNFGDVANSSNGANAASPAGDGIPNLVKYALCLDPAQWGGLPQPEIANNRLKLSFQRDPARSDITITVEGTSDLVNAPWVPVATSLAGGAFSGNGSVSETPLQGGLQQVEVSDSVDTLTEPRRRFLRIRTTLPAE
jgi:hypothetical protein